MENHELFEKYKNNRSNELRNDLVKLYIPLVSKIVSLLPQSNISFIDREDLESYGYFGLIDAIEKFDISRNVKFETYASTKIRGAVIDYLRKDDFLPRSVRQKQKLIEGYVREYKNSNNEYPSDKQISKMTGLSEVEISKVYISTTLSNMVSVEDLILNNHEISSSATENSPSCQLEKNDLEKALIDEIDLLNQREKQIISLYYHDEITLKEISYVLSVSESRVSQILSKILGNLKIKLQNYV